MTPQEQQMFGMSAQSIREQFMESPTAKMSCMEMVVMGALSDAQEILAAGDDDRARKQMNIAKFILSEMIIAKMGAAR